MRFHKMPASPAAAFVSSKQFMYCSSAFEPSPDQSLADLYKVSVL